MYVKFDTKFFISWIGNEHAKNIHTLSIRTQKDIYFPQTRDIPGSWIQGHPSFTIVITLIEIIQLAVA